MTKKVNKKIGGGTTSFLSQVAISYQNEDNSIKETLTVHFLNRYWKNI